MNIQIIAVMLIVGACVLYLLWKYRQAGKKQTGACACACDGCRAVCPADHMKPEENEGKA